jgi:thermitase
MKRRRTALLIGILCLGAMVFFVACGGGGGGGGGVFPPAPVDPLAPKNTQCIGNKAGVSPANAELSSDGKSPILTNVSGSYVQGELLIKFSDGVSTAAAENIIAGLNGVSLSETMPGDSVWSRWKLVRIPEEASVVEAMADYARFTEVEFVQPNYIYTTTVTPNDTNYGNLWGLNNTGQTYDAGLSTEVKGVPGTDMGMQKAWNTRTDCSSVIVGVLDTGVQYDQVDLVSNMWTPAGGTCKLPDGSVTACPNHGYDFVANDNDPMDRNGHGTHVAGTIGARGNNALGSTGVCWQVQIMAIRVLNTVGSGTTAGIIQGVDFAVDNGAHIINMSLGGGGGFDQAYFDAVERTADQGMIAVVAAGNEGENNDLVNTWPANFDLKNIISVAAMTPTGQMADFSNYGPKSVDIAAPGTFIESTYPLVVTSTQDDFTGWNGFAAGQWGRSGCTSNGTVYDMLSNPDDYCGAASPTYDAGVMQTYKTFTEYAGADIATLSFYADFQLNDDRVNFNYFNGTANPFAGGGTNFGYAEGSTKDNYLSAEYDLSACIGASCSIGFELISNATSNSGGFGLVLFTLNKKVYNTKTITNIHKAPPWRRHMWPDCALSCGRNIRRQQRTRSLWPFLTAEIRWQRPRPATIDSPATPPARTRTSMPLRPWTCWVNV